MRFCEDLPFAWCFAFAARMTKPISQFSVWRSLQSRLVLAVLMTLLPMFLLLMAVSSSTLQSESRALLQQQQAALVASLANQVETALDARFRALEQVAGDFEYARAWRTRAAAQEMLRQRPILLTLFNAGTVVISSDDQLVAGWPSMLVGEGHSTLPALALPAAHPARQAWVQVDGVRRVVYLAVPIGSGGGTTVAYLVGRDELDGSGFVEAILRSMVQMPGRYLLTGRDGGADASWVRTVVEPDGALSRPRRWAESDAPTSDGEWLQTRAAVAGTSWDIVGQTPSNWASDAVLPQLKAMWLSGLVFVLLASAFGWWCIRQSLAPLFEAIRQLSFEARSTTPQRVVLDASRMDEVGVLLDGFNRLLDVVGQREQELARGQQHLQDILDHVDARVYLKERSGRYIFGNRGFLEGLGLRSSEFIGRRDEDFFDAATCAVIRRNDARVWKEGCTVRGDETVKRKGSHKATTFLSIKLPMRASDGSTEALCGISTDITDRKSQEMNLRIAAVAFEGHEGIVVLDKHLEPMRVNRAFEAITGYTLEQMQGEMMHLLTSKQLQPSVAEHLAQALRDNQGVWRGQLEVRHAKGHRWIAKLSVSVVRDESGGVSHYVVNMVDDTPARDAERERERQEAAHRAALVREVHHRIKNNLQGILALLRQFANKTPALAEPMFEAIGQVQAISTIHGLQGKSATAQMRLCELVDAIAEEIGTVWQCQVHVLRPLPWQPWHLSEREAVPVALILHELLLNAVKHSGNRTQGLDVQLRRSGDGTGVELLLNNTGHWPGAKALGASQGSGLALIDALMPRHGACLRHWQQGGVVWTSLELVTPIIAPETTGVFAL